MFAPILNRWSLFVIFNHDYNNIMYFKDLKRSIDGISSWMLSKILKKLESSDLIVGTVYSEVSPCMEYRLIELAERFEGKPIEMSDWLISAKGTK